MDIQEAARKLDGCEYRNEGSRELFAEMKAAGLVAVFGQSDDIVGFFGAIDDETSPGEIAINASGEIMTEDDGGPGVVLTALFGGDRGENGEVWTIRTDLPCARFSILEDGEGFSEGIVFRMEEIRARQGLHLVSAVDRDLGATLFLRGDVVGGVDFDEHGSAGERLLGQVARNLSRSLSLPLVETELDDDDYREMTG